MIASYQDLLVQVMRLMDGDNVSIGALEVATLNQIVGLAEDRIYSEVRCRHNEKAFSGVSVSGNVAALPDDFEAPSVVHFGAKALEPAAEEWIRELNASASGRPMYFCEAGAGYTFGPPAGDGDVLQGRYYFRFPPLDSSTFADNTLIQREPSLFIFACLAEGAAFFGKDPSIWEAKYQAILHRLNTAKARTAHDAGRIRIRPSARVAESGCFGVFTQSASNSTPAANGVWDDASTWNDSNTWAEA